MDMLPSFPAVLAYFLGIILLNGCAVSTVTTAANEPLDRSRPPPLVARADFVTEREEDVGRPFIGISISGGGTRAALLGWHVLHELDNMGFLDSVDSISSVSGGSLPAAIYALKGPSLHSAADWDAVEVQLRHDFLTEWTHALLSPARWAHMATSDYERTHVMEEIFDEELFKGATFNDLGRLGTGRPKLFLNSTSSVNAYGSQFTFDAASFRGLNSRLDTYPIADAVMASGAFPGVFGNITLKVFDDKVFDFDTGVQSSIITYERLYDGGASDNLGIWPLLKRARQAYGRSLVERKRMRGCLFIIVDANTPDFSAQLKGYTADTDHTFVDLIIKSTAWESIDALLSVNRLKTLQSLGLHNFLSPFDPSQRYLPMRVAYLTRAEAKVVVEERWTREYESIGHFPLFGPTIPWGSPDSNWDIAIEHTSDGRQEARNLSLVQRDVLEKSSEAAAPVCLVWHVTLERIQSVSHIVFRDGEVFSNPSRSAEEALDYSIEKLGDENVEMLRPRALPAFDPNRMYEIAAIYGFRTGLWALMGSLKTNYRLSGPKGCSNDFIAAAIKSTASLLIREDTGSLDAVCQWFEKMNLRSSCGIANVPISSWNFTNAKWEAFLARTAVQPGTPVFKCEAPHRAGQ